MTIVRVSQSVVAFNIESEAWRSFSQNSNVAFGYKVIQKDASSLIVSDPLLQSQNKRGQIYRCDVNQPGNCSPLQMNEPPEAVNMSLGLSMTKDPSTPKIMACGPTIPKDCKVTTTYNGMCLNVDRGNFEKVPNKLRDCPPPSQTDIAFLLDGSGSVWDTDFTKMKKFVLTLSQGLRSRDVRFAVAQYSYVCKIHVDFTRALDYNTIMSISQMDSNTNTGKAINKLVNELFVRARANANRVLIVITDGESSKGDDNLQAAANNAERNKIIRYAIGVGSAFVSSSAEKELDIIASDPDSEHKFKVDNFDVLDKILKTLETNIIAIEGTQVSGDSTRMEFAQDGFSAAFISNGNIILSAVGAYQWKGGCQEYESTRQYSFQQGSEHDSYLGYSMTVATVWYEPFIVLGAPRHGHKGAVVVTRWWTKTPRQLNSPEPQTGAYFGAEVCGVDLNSDSNTDLLLVSAPLHTQDNREGKVFVYTMSQRVQLIQFKMTLEGMAGQRGRFGSSLASPTDLNGDKVRDVVVGSPLEDDGQGSIYIFNGRQADINPIYSQRISGSSVRSGLQFFGISLSESAVDHSGDSLLDIAVGSKGTVTVLRSRPVVTLRTKVTYNPLKISTKQTDCTNRQKNTLTVCFTMSEINSPIRDLSGKVNYSLKLDAKRQTYRAYFSEKNRLLSNKVTVSGTQETCTDHKFFIEPCPEDALNPLINEVTFTFEGVPISSKGNLKPVLLPAIKNSSDHNLDFEINCGRDNICMDDLKVDFNFSGQSDIKVGIMQELNITVFVENRGENSYNSHVQLTYPFGLSFRKFTSKQGRVECSSLDSEQIGSLGTTTCYINKPILQQNTVGVFEITYSINTDSDFNKMVSFTATAASGNDEHSPLSELTQSKTIGVKYAIYVAIVKHESSSLHINFTSGKYDLEKPVTQIFKVENDLRDVNLTIFISVPIKLGDKDIWTDKDLQIPDCSKDRDEKPKTSDFVAALKLSPEVNCTVATCRIFRCNIMLLRQDVKLYNISANVGSGWIQQTELRSVVFELVSTATMEYDTNTYLYFSSDSLHTPPIGRIITQVEVYEEKDLLKETIGGAVGGLLLLALITAGLYKAGFFKSQYKQMLEEAGGDGADGAAAPEGELS